MNSIEDKPILKPSEQFLLDWGRAEGHITNWEMNDYFAKWCCKFYPDFNEVSRRKLQAKLTYQANKLVKLGYFNKCHRVGLGPDAKVELFGSTQSIWNLTVPKTSAPTPPPDDGKQWNRLVCVGGKLEIVPCEKSESPPKI